ELEMDIDTDWMPSAGAIETDAYVPDLEAANTAVKIGYAHIGSGVDFHKIVFDGFEAAAAQVPDMELMLLDHNYDPATAIDNVQIMINEGVDAAIIYQCDVSANDTIGAMLREADIPTVVIDCPIPGTPFFGGNNSIAGRVGGVELGERFLEIGWDPEKTGYVWFEASISAEANELRLQGYTDGLLEVVPDFPEDNIFRVDTESSAEDTLDKASAWLAAHPEFDHLLIGALHDGPAQGAYQALLADPAGRLTESIIVSQGCDGTAQGFIRDNDPTFVGSVDYGPGLYGFNSISMALDLLNGDPVPAFWYANHVNCEADTVDELYPNGEVQYPWES
ncbi:MAG: sugar ABC transporter substrate-binding protein, partial [Actinomycetota bacterium]|nr:sugar ABC transporter substrate-binding protein [Actinomycetota bacterium]